jgi:ribosome-binding factor A
MTRRAEQLASEIHRAVQAAIDRGLQDPRISGMITITAVRITPDHKSAHLDVSILPAEKQDLTMHGLRHAAKHLRHVIGEEIRTRQMPELVFRLDQSLKKQAEVMGAIARAAEDRQRREADGKAPPAASEAGSASDDAYAQEPARPPQEDPA